MDNQDTTLPLPLVHMNGTGQRSLQEDYDQAHEALEAFLETWRKMEFHPRDYYPLGDSAWSEALEARQAINQKLKDVEDYITAHRIHIHNQGK